jgi:fructose-bisphosphate aldolase class I
MPIVEPDVSLSGTHTLEQAVDINIKIQAELFKAMIDHGVYMPGTTLKPNIINPGKNCPVSYSVEEIAEANIYVLEQSFPVAMPGANFLSGGQTLAQGTARLSAMNKVKGNAPWYVLICLSLELKMCFHDLLFIKLVFVSNFTRNLSFSWSQALQLPLLELCKDKGELQLEEMSKLYVEELKLASAASLGEHTWEEGDGDHASA